MPERLLVALLVSADIDNVALPVPEVSESVSQAASEEAVHVWLEVTVNVLLPPEEVKEADVGVTLKVGAAASCVTEMVCDIVPSLRPEAETIIRASRSVMEVLAAALTTTEVPRISRVSQLASDVTSNGLSPSTVMV